MGADDRRGGRQDMWTEGFGGSTCGSMALWVVASCLR